jgi:hypothetical protein
MAALIFAGDGLIVAETAKQSCLSRSSAYPALQVQPAPSYAIRTK